MSRRERLVRTGLALLVVVTLAVLVVRDLRDEGTDPPTGSPSTTAPPTDAPSAGATTEPTSPAPSPGDGNVVPAPPDGLEQLVCEVFRQPLTLRVLSFNTHRSSGSVAGVAAEIRAIDPDIALLQEVDRFQARTGGADQATQLAELLDMQSAFSANLVRGRGQYGTLVLSRFPIVQQGRFSLAGRAGAEPRGLQWVTLDVAGRAVRVFNTHLDAVRPRVRMRQAQQVAATAARERVPVVVGGDLNAWPGSAPVAMLSQGLTDTWTVGSGRAATGVGGRKIDYLFVRGLRPLRSQVAPSALSDHHRLWADVRLPAPRCPDATEK